MFTIQQQQSLAWLQQYLAETPKEVIQAEIDAITAMQFEGPSVKDYFQNFHKAFILEDTNIQKRPARISNTTIFRIKNGESYVSKHIRIHTNIQNKYGKHVKEMRVNKILTSNIKGIDIQNQNNTNTI